jgi:hypothetical protein
MGFVNVGLSDDLFEINQIACTSIDFFNEYLYQNMKRPRKKQPQLSANILQFY